jgi:acyl-CoA synthetase (AMP-forming)/AMP-acid ligase II
MSSATKIDAILSAWRKTLGARAGSAAIFSTRGEVLRTFSDIDAEADNLAETLARFASGSVVAMQIGNSEQWPALLIAARRLGLIPLPLGRHMEKSETEAALATCCASALLEIRDGELISSALRAPHSALDCDFLKLTSGTTGAPRAIRFRSEQLVADCDNICETMGIGANDVNFGVIPFSHSYGFSNLVTPLVCRGVPLVASEDRMPRAILDDLARTSATVFPSMPVFFQAFAEMENAPELPHLRLCISAGAPLSKNVAARFAEKFGVKIHVFYGSSECGGICYDSSDSTECEDGFVGTAMKNVTTSLCEKTEPSRIEIRSAAVGDDYFPTPDPDALGGGRFLPGDLLRKTARGFFLAGRVSDFINIAGRKLNPAEIEERILKFPGVKQAVVFGVPSPLRGEEPVACVAACGVSREAVLAFCRENLSAWQVPKDIWLVDAIPVNERGKISRRELAARFAGMQKSENACS